MTTASGADLAWSATDRRAVDLVRIPAMDAVQRAGSGHPGTAVSLAPAARVVSLPCVQWFTAQEPSCQEQVLRRLRARVCVEAGIALGWRAFAGDRGECVSLEHFGASADYQVLFEKFGFTAERVADAARVGLARVARLARGNRS